MQRTKRDRGLSHRGQHSLVLERAAPLQQGGKKTCSQGFHTHAVEVFGGFHILPPSPALSILPLVPVLIHICSTAAQGAESSHEFQGRSRSQGWFPLLPKAFLLFFFGATHSCKGQKKWQTQLFISGELLSTACPALVLSHGTENGWMLDCAVVFSSQVNKAHEYCCRVKKICSPRQYW